ncbi:MAG: hypothetical protein WDM77_08560 [Steroidobacteraceae bacterium]
MIRDVVFDIGRVIVAIHPQPWLDFLVDHGAPRLDLKNTLEHIAINEHETGRMDGAGLIERLVSWRPERRLRICGSRWLEMFTPEEEMVQLARRVTPHHGVYLLSNIGDLHWDHLVTRHGIDRIGHGALTSFHAGVMKPDTAIYAQAEQSSR